MMPSECRIVAPQACRRTKKHFMKSRILVAVAALLAVFSIPAAAQEYPKLEVPIGFSFVNVYPDITPITSFNIFGGGGFVYNFLPMIGIKTDFQGYCASP